MTTTSTIPAAGFAASTNLRPARQLRRVQVWAIIGACFLALQAYVYLAWIFSGHATRTPTGPTPMPGWMSVTLHTLQVGSIIGFLALGYFVVVRPWRRRGGITLDGLFVLVALTLYWQDPMLNWFQPWFAYNSALINFGSWTSSIPGWYSPRGHLLAEPIVAALPMYTHGVIGPALLGSWLLHRVRNRWPRLRNVSLVAGTVVFFFCFDLFFELTLMRVGMYQYGGSISWLTIFHGRYYQFPIYQTLLMGVLWPAWTFLRHFRNDKGQTVAEVGIEEMQISQRRATGLRFLALVGICNLIYLCAYNVPIAISGLYADPWPQDITKRSYLMNGLCGAGTPYECSGPGVPVPRRDSARLTPDGTLAPAPRG